MMKIGICERRPFLRQAMVSLLGSANEEFEVVSLPNDPVHEVLSVIKSEGVNVVIASLDTPSSGVCGMVHAVSERFDRVRCVVLLTCSDASLVSAAIRAGAKGVVAPSAYLPELVQAILTVRGGFEYFSKEVTDLLVDRYVDGVVSADDDAPKEPDIDSLSARQIEILRLWGDNMSNKDIADKLFLSVRTVESHKNHIMQKLNLKTTVDIIRFGIRNNIIKL